MKAVKLEFFKNLKEDLKANIIVTVSNAVDKAADTCEDCDTDEDLESTSPLAKPAVIVPTALDAVATASRDFDSSRRPPPQTQT